MNPKKIELMFEFLIFGIIIGITEDLLAIKLATGEPITLKTIGIIILLAIPFAVLGEIIADRIDFVKVYKRVFKKGQFFINH
ncbi:hypothetical protein KKD19_04615 [Patescibacteria group bacterium]|nr:hypothetical protein [Patescibacteria group bacterium]MBU4512491.1 hypothetical protein [Patescibacteria group bacterium]MCG2692803.1 hypothetical protein [Candidatus Parcubacteria bacterium]